jgi:hypothetical protein
VWVAAAPPWELLRATKMAKKWAARRVIEMAPPMATKMALWMAGERVAGRADVLVRPRADVKVCAWATEKAPTKVPVKAPR